MLFHLIYEVFLKVDKRHHTFDAIYLYYIPRASNNAAMSNIISADFWL